MLGPLLGILTLVVLGTFVHVDLTLPSPTTHGEVSISDRPGSVAAALIAFAGHLGLALAPYAGLLMWRATRDRQNA